MQITRIKMRPAVMQLLLFIVIAVNIECFCWLRMQQTGLESSDSTAQHDAHRGWRMRSGPGQDPLNSDGLRGPELPTDDPGTELRILDIGGSVTYGLRLKEWEAYPAVLQNLLKANNPGEQVFNGGTPGFSTTQMLGLLTEIGPKIKPQIVTVMCGFNEHQAEPYRNLEPEAANGIFRAHDVSDRARSVLYKSATYRYLTYLLRPPAIPDIKNIPTTPGSFVAGSLSASVDNLKLIKYFADQHNMKLVLLMEAHRSKTLGARTAGVGVGNPDGPSFEKSEYLNFLDTLAREHKQTAQELGVPFLDMSEVQAKSGIDEEKFFLPGDPCHLTPLGCTTVAEALAALLKQNGLVK